MFLLVLLLGNEVRRKKYIVFAYRMSVYFVALYSFLIFYLPILAAEISPRIFILSGFAAVVGMTIFGFGLGAFLGGKVRSGLALLVWLGGGAYLAINVMYFANIIPPIPLSMEHGGVYYTVTHTATDYIGLKEKQPWYVWLQQYPIIHRNENDPLYVFASVFAPTRITTTIVHVWQYYDENVKQWRTASRLPLSIIGGRDGGYRSYTYKTNTTLGKWRVNIETERGQLIGRIKFNIESGSPINLLSKTL